MEDDSIEQVNRKSIINATLLHLHKLTNVSCKNNDSEIEKLKTHYAHVNRIIRDIMDVPQLYFNETKMCSHCSTIWNPDNCSVRICSVKKSGKKSSQMRNQKDKKSRVSRELSILSKKKMKNKNQVIHIKCLKCYKLSAIPLRKPKRRKPIKIVQPPILNTCVKKKKKPKDKFCNLNITVNSSLNSSLLNNSLDTDILKVNKTKTPVQKKQIKKEIMKLTPVQKIAKMNKLKLESVLNDTSLKKRKSGLGSFLKELF